MTKYIKTTALKFKLNIINIERDMDIFNIHCLTAHVSTITKNSFRISYIAPYSSLFLKKKINKIS